MTIDATKLMPEKQVLGSGRSGDLHKSTSRGSINASFDIVDSAITGNLIGIQMRPTRPAAVNGIIGCVTVADNGSGLVPDGSAGAGVIDVVVVSSIVRGGQNGILSARRKTHGRSAI